jgi:hypothetical protein
MAAVLLAGAPPEGLILAMLVSYLLGLTGMLLAYLNYRKRRAAPDSKHPHDAREGQHKP